MEFLAAIPEAIWVALLGLVGVLSSVITAAVKDRTSHGLQTLQSAMEGQAALNQSLMRRIDQLEKRRTEQELKIVELERRMSEKDSRLDCQEKAQIAIENDNQRLANSVSDLQHRLDERDRAQRILEKELQHTQTYVAVLRQHINDRKPPPPPEPNK